MACFFGAAVKTEDAGERQLPADPGEKIQALLQTVKKGQIKAWFQELYGQTGKARAGPHV